MSRKLVGCKEINLALENILKEYAAECSESIRESANAAGKKAVKTLKTTSPKGVEDGQVHYASGWTLTEEKSRYATGFTIHNKKKPGLAHLLEHGHAKRGGGRVEGRTHIGPVEEQAIKDFEEELRKRLAK